MDMIAIGFGIVGLIMLVGGITYGCNWREWYDRGWIK